MSDELKQLAIAYFQHSLSKFCPADKDRPNGYEIDMFVAGYSFCDIELTKAEDKIQELEAENARYREALEFYASLENRKIPLGPDGYLPSKIDSDRGSIAREALKGGE